MGLDRCAHELGRGMLAATAGTALMTASSTLEMRLRGRPPSDAPGRAAERLLRVRVQDDLATGRLARAGHLLTGASLGVVRGLIGCARLREPLAGSVFMVASLTPDAAVLPALRIVPPPWRWSATDLAVSVGHHLAFAAGTSAAYAALGRSAARAHGGRPVA